MAESLLAVHIRSYSQQLHLHLAHLREQHAHLELAWVRLREIYEGQGAQVFGEAFSSASARLTDYSEQGGTVAQLLEAKLEELRRFQAQGSEL